MDACGSPQDQEEISPVEDNVEDMAIEEDMVVVEQEPPPCSPNCPDLGFVQLEGGTFSMGSDRGWSANEAPAHSVTVPSFEMMEAEITVAQYRACVEDGFCQIPEGEGRDETTWNWVASSETITRSMGFVASAQHITSGWRPYPHRSRMEYAARGGRGFHMSMQGQMSR